MAITKFYKILTPAVATSMVGDNQHAATSAHGGSYTNYSWYNNLVYGSTQRISKYREYDVMDDDIDIARALDIIAEEMTGNNPKGQLPLSLKTPEGPERRLTSNELVTLKAALNTWCKIQDWDNRLFTTCRNVVKYGDCFFLRPKSRGKKWAFVHPRNVVGAAVSDFDITDIKKWEIRPDVKQTTNGSMTAGFMGIAGGNSNGASQYGSAQFDFDDVVWFSLYNDMSDEAPFGVSILKSVFKTFKQKELLEDAILIYRIQRAPERRVFYIDVGKLAPHLVPGHLEQLKNEIKQKRIPSSGGGSNQVDSMYNAQSMSEDFYFAVDGKNGSGSRVETLPAGQNLGELQDLDYFYKKIWRGMRIPESYINNSAEGSTPATDGKVGIAYQQEIKFTLYIERLQRAIEGVLDKEFKRFLHDCKIKIDETAFDIVLPEPSNYAKSRQQQINAELLNNFATADGITSLSKRFSLAKYLGLSEEDIIINERMKREEMGLPSEGGMKDLPMLYNPEIAESRGFDGGLGGGGEGDFFLDDEDGLGDEEGLDDLPPEDGTDEKPADDAKK